MFFDESRAILGKKNYYFFYTTLEYFSFSTLIFLNIPERRFKYIFITGSIVFSILMILIYSFLKVKRLDSYSIGIESIVMIIFILYFFYYQLQNISNQSIYEYFAFWVVLGIMVYIGFTFFFSILANNLSPEFVSKYYTYTYLGDIIKNVLFSISILFLSRTKTSNYNPIPKLDMI